MEGRTMTNAQMTPNRFGRWSEARTQLRKIVNHLEAGGRVMVATYTKATVFDARHVEKFKATKSGLYAQYGKRWDCIDGCAIRFSK